MEKDKKLTLDDLEEVVGGRKFNQEEIDMWREVKARFDKLLDLYYRWGLNSSRYYMEQEFNKACENWRKAVLSAPEEAGTISFYDFFDFEYYERI